MENKALCRIAQFFIKIFYYFIYYPDPKVTSGEGSFIKLAEIIKEDGYKKPLIVTGKFHFNSGAHLPLTKKLEEIGLSSAVFSDVFPNPTCENVLNGFEVYKIENCDCIVAFGGGSPMDAAKIIGAKVAKPKKDVRKFLNILSIRKKIPMLYAVPTTSGTGSESTIASVITDEKTGKKIPMCDPVLMPKRAILDPLLTEGLPSFMTATTGMDALSHAVEAYTNKKYNTKKENELCEKAVKLIHDNLLKAYHDGHDMEARKNMQFAALYAGRAVSRGGVGYVHAIGHALGSAYHISHGEAMAIILPKVLRKYGSSAEKRLAKLATICDMPGNNDKEKANEFISWIEKANKEMNFLNYFAQIKESDIEQISKWAIREANPLYPCPQIWKVKDIEEILRELQGK